MLEKIYNYANSHDTSSEPRHLTNEERAAALMLLPSYFKDSEEELEKLVTTMTVVPKRFYGSTFFTEKTYTFIKEQFKEFPELLRQIKAEYFSNLLGMNGEVAMKYVEDMDKLRTILAQKTGTKVKLSDFDFKGEYTQEDLKKARWEMDRRENIWDNALDRCMPYRLSWHRHKRYYCPDRVPRCLRRSCCKRRTFQPCRRRSYSFEPSLPCRRLH